MKYCFFKRLALMDRKCFCILISTVIVMWVLMNTYITSWNDKSRPIVIRQIKSKICSRMDLNVDIQKPSIAASFGDGRTANQLCNFASGYALWREYGILNYLDEYQLNLLRTTFELPILNEENDTSSYYLWRKGNYINVKMRMIVIIIVLFPFIVSTFISTLFYFRMYVHIISYGIQYCRIQIQSYSY